MFERHLTAALQDSLADTPVTVLAGARQTGKTTLAQALIADGWDAEYLTLDDAATLRAAASDPEGFVRGVSGSVVIDEIQRVPELLLAIKRSVDRDRRPGRFLLTGSADVLLLPRVSESLAGRLEVRTLWPLSQGEIGGERELFVDRLLGYVDDVGSPRDDGVSAVARVVRGGYPSALPRAPARRDAWFASYLGAIIDRDIRDLANIDRLTAMPRLLGLLASRTAATVNAAELARTSAIPQTSLQRYLTLLEHVFLLRRIPAWHANLGKRLVRSPKLHVCDSGLAAHLLGASEAGLARSPQLAGQLLESFVVMEVVKQCSWRASPPRVHHYRTAALTEVDIVLEDRAGTIAGVEVKSGATVGPGDFRGLRELAAAHGDRFAHGVVLYGGDAVVPFGERLAAWPLALLWAG